MERKRSGGKLKSPLKGEKRKGERESEAMEWPRRN